jgi:hypothetical protein
VKIERCKYNKKTKPDVVSVLDEKKKVVREIDLPAYLEAPGKREQFLCVSKPRWGYFEHAFTAYITRHLIRHRTLGTIACYCVHNPDHHITLELTQLKEFYVLTLD